MNFQAGNIKIDTSDLQKKFNKLSNALYDPTGVFTHVFSDLQRRAPGKVADAVRTVYNIKKSDLMPTKKKTDLKRAVKFKIKGQTIADLKLYYEGRRLTPLHFGLTPNTQPEKGKKYKLKMRVKKKRVTLKSPNGANKVPFIAPAKKGSQRHIAWLRDVNGEIEPIKTIGVPQMIGPNEQGKGGNPLVIKQVSESLNDLLDKRFNHYMQQHMKKATS